MIGTIATKWFGFAAAQWVGFAAGPVIGACVGLLVVSLCVAAARGGRVT